MANNASAASPRFFNVRELSDPATPHVDAAYVAQRGYTLVLLPRPGATGEHDLYVNETLIAPDSWAWQGPSRLTLVWSHPVGSGETIGHILFAPDQSTGSGTLKYVDFDGQVTLDATGPLYDCQLSVNSGATLASQGLTLSWDPKSAAWQNASWVGALQLSYWIKSCGQIGTQSVDKVMLSFADTQTSRSWTTCDCPSPNQAIFSATNGVAFDASDLDPPPPDDRSGLPAPQNTIATVFPYKMALQLDDIGYSFTGAVLIGAHSTAGMVYGIKGVAANPSILGTYALTGADGRPTALLAVRGGHLVADGAQVPESSISANRLRWSGLPDYLVQRLGLPADGHVDFSPDGHTVVGASLAAGGSRVGPGDAAALAAQLRAGAPVALAAAVAPASSSPPALTLYGLLNLDPDSQNAEGNYTDIVQSAAMSDFYQVLQYYMPSNLRQEFVNPNNVVLDPSITPIAHDNSANGPWYSALATPYLVNALGRYSSDPYAKKLNAARANKYLSAAVAPNPVYNDQAAKLYAAEWVKQFPITSSYISDQQQNAGAYQTQIDAIISQWVADITTGADGITDPQNQAAVQAAVAYVNSLKQPAYNGQYWSLALLRYLTKYYFPMLRAQMTDGNTSMDVTLKIKRFSALFGILDPSNFFAQQFVDAFRIWQLGSLLPQFVDFGGNQSNFSYAVYAVLQGFVDAYVNSSDPAMQQRAQEMQQLLAEKDKQRMIDPFISAFLNGATTFGTNWNSLLKNFEAEATTIGKALNITGSLLDAAVIGTEIGFGAVSIAFLISGKIDWRDLTDTQKGQFVTAAVGCFVRGVAGITKGTLSAVGYFQDAGDAWGTIKSFFSGVFKAGYDNAHEQFQNGFARWLVRNGESTGIGESDIAILFEQAATADEEFAAAYPKTAALFGRNLEEFMATRLAAALAIANIVFSAISLAHSEAPLDTAMNSLFLASSCLELVSAAAGWALGVDGLLTADAAIMAVSTIASLAAGLAILAAIAGIVILIIELENQKPPPSPVQVFAQNQASSAGYYMPDGVAIDYMQILPDTSGAYSTIGVALMLGNDDQQCLQMTVSGSTGKAGVHAIDFTWDTVFLMSTDEYGRMLLATQTPDLASKQYLALTVDDNGALTAQGPVTDSTKTLQQRWLVDIVGASTTDASGNLTSAVIQLKNAYWDQKGTAYYLSSGPSLSSTPAQWTIALKGMKPDGLSYNETVVNTITLQTNYLGYVFYPYVGQVGSDTDKTWSISPELPSFLAFDTKTGAISQVAGVAPPVTAAASYVVTLANQYGSVSVTVTIEVVSAPTPAVATA